LIISHGKIQDIGEIKTFKHLYIPYIWQQPSIRKAEWDFLEKLSSKMELTVILKMLDLMFNIMHFF